MKTELIKTKTYDITQGMSPIEEELIVEVFEDIQEALLKLGSEECLKIINQVRVSKARIEWRNNKVKELHPPLRKTKALWSRR